MTNKKTHTNFVQCFVDNLSDIVNLKAEDNFQEMESSISTKNVEWNNNAIKHSLLKNTYIHAEDTLDSNYWNEIALKNTNKK